MVVATYNMGTLAVMGKTGMAMTSVYWRRADNLAVTSLACRKLGEPTVRHSRRKVPSFLFRSGENNT